MNVYKTLFVNVVFCECKICSVILSEEHWFRVIGQVCESEKLEITGAWRKLHNEELHTLFFSPNLIHGDEDRLVYSIHGEWEMHTGFWSEEFTCMKPHKTQIGG